MHNRITLLQSRSEHIVNQPYFNLKEGKRTASSESAEMTVNIEGEQKSQAGGGPSL